MPAGHSGSMVVPDVFGVVPDGADHVAFHDLHVIDVVEKLEALGVELLRERHAPRRAIALVVAMIHLRVEKLHADGHTVLLRRGHELAEPARTAGESLLVAHSISIARETDQVRNSRRGREWNGTLVRGHERRMICGVVE